MITSVILLASLFFNKKLILNKDTLQIQRDLLQEDLNTKTINGVLNNFYFLPDLFVKDGACNLSLICGMKSTKYIFRPSRIRMVTLETQESDVSCNFTMTKERESYK